MIQAKFLFSDNDSKTWLFDILHSIAEIESYFEGRLKRIDDNILAVRTKWAVRRDIEIRGEAVDRILKKDIDFKIENSQRTN